MKVEEIKKHIDDGHLVTINNGAYKLIKDNLNQYLSKEYLKSCEKFIKSLKQKQKTEDDKNV